MAFGFGKGSKKPQGAEPASEDGNEAPRPEFTEKDKANARRWFEHGEANRNKRDYDYAIECYIQGLTLWPEAVDEGHMPLRSTAVQRQQAGGKKPTMMETMKLPMTGKDFKKAMLNAEHLMAKDPSKGSYYDGLIKNAAKANYFDTLKYYAPIVIESLKRDAKPDKARFKNFRESLVAASEAADRAGNHEMATLLLERAVESLDFQVARTPGDDALRDEQRDLSGKLAISRGKYEQAESFRDSIQDAEAQKRLHDAERAQQGSETRKSLLDALQKDFEENPSVASKLNSFIDALLKPEEKELEDRAIAVLDEQAQVQQNYSFKVRADDVRIKQLRRAERQLRTRAADTGSDEDLQNQRLAQLDLANTELQVFRERARKYPTDLRIKYRLGTTLFKMKEFDEAIGVLQQAQADPRTRWQCQLYIGRSFIGKTQYAQAVEVLRESLEAYELTDEISKELMYWLAYAYEHDSRTEDAKAAYGKLLRIDYNYRSGEARQRMEKL